MTEKYIGVNAFISVLKERQREFDGCQRAFGKTATCVLEETINKLQSFPTADVAPIVHAHWETIFDELGNYGFEKCSACGDEYGSLTYRYCPNCGARMDEEVKDDD